MSPRDDGPKGSDVPDVADLARPMLDLYGPHDDHDDEHAAGPDAGPDTRYAREPLFPVNPDTYEAIRAATALDSNRYLRSGLAPVDCRRCGATVQVKKFAPGYTAVQWNSGAFNRCAYFAEQRDTGQDTKRDRGCPNLTASIKHAVAEGLLEETAPASLPADD